ncbi:MULTISPECIES: hypothetical protein [unclassified Herbaspirillum]|uniref:hypothetical protein n=1 Tax=unclassified Herbaspirillum TaxID=2624150 RepID=UPI001154F4E8|nr:MULTISPECIES: hypothetical protein [unclassified Herbaspirillum]MBB5392887.1 hypothetical protein [Herbaspirillum sp. SJZ102]TQK04467.1 hypothetical protein FB599_3021 [Herbaspirillum sp. SJZ130]TQK09748.1 hypothetical protein FB598_2741 [Herbaspirillum sp. SJZ106]
MKRFLYLLAAPAVLLLSGCVAVPYDPYYGGPVAYPAQPVYAAPYPYYSYPSTSIYFGYGGGWGGGRGHWRR